jgi:hypothetical protein
MCIIQIPTQFSQPQCPNTAKQILGWGCPRQGDHDDGRHDAQRSEQRTQRANKQQTNNAAMLISVATIRDPLRTTLGTATVNQLRGTLR